MYFIEFILSALTSIKYNGEGKYLRKMLGNNLKFSFIKTYSNVKFQVFPPKYCLSCQINCFQRVGW